VAPHPGRPSAASAALSAAALALALAAPAGAEWAAPLELSAVSGNARLPQVAIAPSGVATVVWEAEDGPAHLVQARRIDAGGAAGPVIDVSEPGERAFNARVAVDAAGDATVVWERPAGPDWIARTRRIDPAGALGAARDVSPAGAVARLPRVAVDASGVATVLWRVEGADDVLQARRVDPAGALGPVLDVSAPGDVLGHEVVASSGAALAAWSRLDGGGYVAEARIVGAASPPFPLSDPGVDAQVGGVASAPGGDATVVWETGAHAIQARRAGAAGPAGAVHDLGTGDAPQVAVDASGAAAVVWLGAAESVALRRLAPTPGDAQTLSAAGETAEGAAVAVDGTGNAVVAWRSFADAGDLVRARGASVGGALAAPADVSALSEEVEPPRLAVDAAGDAVAAWAAWDGTRYRVVAARSAVPPPPAPPPLPAAPPATTPVPAAPPGCAPVTAALRPAARARPRSPAAAAPRARVKGVTARVRLSAPGRVELLRASLSYRRGGRAVRAPLAGRRAVGTRLRLALPRRLARTLPARTRVTLRARLRAAGPGCTFGPPGALTLRTRVVWLPTTGGNR
jgi:hypothetical protein